MTGLGRVPAGELDGVELDRRRLRNRVRSIAGLPRLIGRPTEAQLVVAAAQSVLATCAEQPLATPAGTARWAIETLWSWLEKTAWVLVLDPDAEVALAGRLEGCAAAGVDSEEFLEPVSAWLSPRLVHRDSGRLVSGAMYDATGASKLVFIATRVSNIVGPDERRRAAEHSQAVADVAYALGGFRCHQTAILADPTLETSHSPGWREQDEDVIAVSDLVVLVWDAPADGFGAVAEMARRYGVPVVIVKVGAGRLSPMLLGESGTPTQVLPADSYAEELADLLRHDRLDLTPRQRLRRAADLAAAAQLTDIRQALETLDDGELGGTGGDPDLVTMTRARFRRLLHHPTLWRAATGHEQSVVRRVARWTPPLDYPEARALTKVHDALMLDAATALRLEHAGRREKAVAGAGKARFDATHPEAWLALFKKLGRP